jgi:hypothetical protein
MRGNGYLSELRQDLECWHRVVTLCCMLFFFVFAWTVPVPSILRPGFTR